MPVQGRAGETRVLQDALDTGFLVSILRKDLRSDFQQLRPTRGRSLSLGGAIGQSRLHAPRSCCPPSVDGVRSGDRKSVVEGKSGSVGVDLGGRRIHKKNKIK